MQARASPTTSKLGTPARCRVTSQGGCASGPRGRGRRQPGARHRGGQRAVAAALSALRLCPAVGTGAAPTRSESPAGGVHAGPGGSSGGVGRPPPHSVFRPGCSGVVSRNAKTEFYTQGTSGRGLPRLPVRGVTERPGSGPQNRLRGFESRHHVREIPTAGQPVILL